MRRLVHLNREVVDVGVTWLDEELVTGDPGGTVGNAATPWRTGHGRSYVLAEGLLKDGRGVDQLEPVEGVADMHQLLLGEGLEEKGAPVGLARSDAAATGTGGTGWRVDRHADRGAAAGPWWSSRRETDGMHRTTMSQAG